MNQNRMTAVRTFDIVANQPTRPMIIVTIDTQLMKNIVLLLIGSLLFVLCYRVSRRQTAYVNANQANVQPIKTITQGSAIVHTNSSFVMRFAGL